ncbi:MAG: hypothetical protein OEV31_04685 [Gammaproteobacteria bacterium]|nr:hypothetical protein [Gammaproteobacteria bacterium]
MASVMLAAHLGALVCVGLTEMRVWFQLMLGALILSSLAWQWRHSFWWKSADLRISDDGQCAIQGDEPMTARIASADVFAGFIRLRVVLATGRLRTLILARDALTLESYRELCARIRQGRLPAPDQAAMRDPL